MANKQWPPPGYPLVRGDHPLTDTWQIRLCEPFARRIEDGSLVLWRPGLTIWMEVWGNDRNESQGDRLAWMKQTASAERFAERQSTSGGVTRWSYRLRDENEDGALESVYGFVIADDGHLSLSIYFDDPAADEATARQLVDAVTLRPAPP